ncbi:MAG: hypothetical protein DLM60_03540 [Pseudonocardiales bacterium]|nr:hypothetical protein [Actinomycetota bacterium]PZS22950.1 MAG: hypothetical protein DLM60_03540 [Pseudonocardiales bacterium]
MILIVLTVVVIALLIAALAIFLFRIGMLLNRTADDLEDCAQSVQTVSRQAEAIGPGVVRINETGTTVLGALPLLVDGAESVAVAKGAPYGAPPAAAPVTAPAPVRPEAPHVAAHAAAPALVPSRSVGYQDDERGSLGYLDG